MQGRRYNRRRSSCSRCYSSKTKQYEKKSKTPRGSRNQNKNLSCKSSRCNCARIWYTRRARRVSWVHTTTHRNSQNTNNNKNKTMIFSEEEKQKIKETTAVYGLIARLYSKGEMTKHDLDYTRSVISRIGECTTLKQVTDLRREIEQKLQQWCKKKSIRPKNPQ